jgi:3-hydroxybutyryl-CoA dehydrogenase
MEKIAVVGAGQMGAGIAQVAAAKGLAVALSDTDVDRASSAKAKITGTLRSLVGKGKLSEADAEATLSRILPATLAEAARDADLIIEVVTENQAIKLAVFAEMDRHARPGAILASNTSSISITRLAGETHRPEKVVGMHFMNPVPVMKLVEIVSGVQTSSDTLERAKDLAERLGKTFISSRDQPGFVVNRMLIPLLNEACFTLQEGVAPLADIDQAAKLGLNHPMGPFELADLIGLDTVLSISEVLHKQIGDDKYRPSTLLRNLVAAGWLGRKSRRGFYVYDEQGKPTRASIDR